MPRFLVPVDFSSISVNAALYAVQMAESMPKKEVILYNVTEEILAGTDGTPIDFDGEAMLAFNRAALENLQVNLFEMGMSPMEIVAEIGDLQERLKPAVSSQNIDMVVMGIAGNSSYDENFIGKNAVGISRDSTCPVMIVPPEAIFRGSGKIAMAIDYTDVSSTVTIEPIRFWLDILQPEIHVIYVAENGKGELTTAQQEEKAKVESMLAGYETNFVTLPSSNFSEAINKYVEENKVDQIVIFPKKHSMFEGLFSKSHTHKLAHHSTIPVVSVHE